MTISIEAVQVHMPFYISFNVFSYVLAGILQMSKLLYAFTVKQVFKIPTHGKS